MSELTETHLRHAYVFRSTKQITSTLGEVRRLRKLSQRAIAQAIGTRAVIGVGLGDRRNLPHRRIAAEGCRCPRLRPSPDPPGSGMRSVSEMGLINVHPETACAGRPCTIHHPSNHHMVDWPQIWRDDRGIMERRCPHGIGHPDPDDIALTRHGGRDPGVHGCDGCCVSRPEG